MKNITQKLIKIRKGFMSSMKDNGWESHFLIIIASQNIGAGIAMLGHIMISLGIAIAGTIYILAVFIAMAIVGMRKTD